MDSVAFGFAVTNTALAFAGIMATLYGKRYFKAGILVKTMMRGAIVALFLFAHFLSEMLSEIGIINPPPYLEYPLEFGFTLGLAYVTIGFIRDWQKMAR